MAGLLTWLMSKGDTAKRNLRAIARFAAFDPARRNESDLLAGLLPYAIPAGLLGLILTRQGEGHD